jgi:hypothetical protein
MRYIMAIMFTVMCSYVSAHSWTPTYPEITPSHSEGVLRVEMLLWNSRQDVSFFTFEVFDQNFIPIKFATPERTVKVEYLKRKTINIYIREIDKDRAVYVCSRSRIVQQNSTTALVSSRICSKIK